MFVGILTASCMLGADSGVIIMAINEKSFASPAPHQRRYQKKKPMVSEKIPVIKQCEIIVFVFCSKKA